VISGALLVDWGNIAIRRARAGYSCHSAAEIARRLVVHAREHATLHDVDLVALEAFVPRAELDAALIDALQHAGLAVRETPFSANAADYALLSRAFELRFADEVQHFVVASGDAIFCTFANVLRVAGARCDLWPFSRAGAAKTVQDWPHTRYLAKCLELPRCPRTDDDPALRAAVGLHVLGWRGRSCASATVARRDLAGTDLFDDLDRATTAWVLADQLGWFVGPLEPVGDQPRSERRLAYERMSVLAGLLVGDAIIRAVESAGAVAADTISELVEHPLAQDRVPAISTLLQDAAVLATDDDGTLRIADPDLGPRRLVEGVQRVIISMLELPEPVTRSAIASMWTRHYRRLRATKAVQAQTRGCGSDAVRLAAATGALRRSGSGKYRLAPAHPITAAARGAAESAVRVIDAGDLPVPIEVLQERLQDLPQPASGMPQCGWSAEERRVLVSALAGAGHVVIAGESVVALRMTPFVQRTLDAR
jgi:hypothetical protein